MNDRRLDRTSSSGGDLFPAEALTASRRPYLAFKDLLELIIENCATAVGAHVRAEPETFIECARCCRSPLHVQLLPKLMQCRELTRRANSCPIDALRRCSGVDQSAGVACYRNSPSSIFACRRSGVSKPSENQP
jgi:hypothetical protein